MNTNLLPHRFFRCLAVAGGILLLTAMALWAGSAEAALLRAKLAKLAYQEDDPSSKEIRAEIEAQWEELTDYRSNDPITGFKAVVYRNKETGEVVVAFAGTDVTDLRDWGNNLWNHLDGPVPPPQYLQALMLAAEVTKKYGADKVSVTGHSLGGGLAMFVSRSLNLPGTTFNPDWQGGANQAMIAVLRAASKYKDVAPLTNYAHREDIVRFGNRVHNLLGGGMVNYGEDVILDYPVEGMLDAHDLNKLIRHLEGQGGGGGTAPAGGAPTLPAPGPGNEDSGKPPQLKGFR